MFYRLSGFVSELDLDDTAEVFIYLLFPQKFVPFLEDGLFNHFHLNFNTYRGHSNDATLDQYGMIHDHYIPFSMPLKGYFSRDTGVDLDREYNSVLIKWIEENFNVDLTEYFDKLSYQTHPKSATTINEKNIFNFMSVAFEHESFINKIKDSVKDDPEIYLCTKSKSHYFKNKNLTMIQELVSGDNMALFLKKFSQEQLIKYSKVLQHNAKYNIQEMCDSLVEMESLEFFLIRTNKIYKPSSRGGQRISRKYIDLLNEARSDTCDQLFQNCGEE